MVAMVSIIFAGCSRSGGGTKTSADASTSPGSISGNMLDNPPGNGGEEINQSPIANAGSGHTVPLRSLVILDGSQSYDPDHHYPLSFNWTFLGKPAGSQATLFNEGDSRPSFEPDFHGDYEIELFVTDNRGARSDKTTVIVSTINSAPVADAGPHQSFSQAGQDMQLDGSASYDPDGDPITYFWAFTDKPAGSLAELSSVDAAESSFVADVLGTYTIGLTVSDVFGDSDFSTVVITSGNVKPVAVAGSNQVVLVGQTVWLDGSGSYDANFDDLAYRWVISITPEGSSAQLAGMDQATASFMPDMPGAYTVSLVVSDGADHSNPDALTILAVDTEIDEFIELLTRAVHTINGLPEGAFANHNHRKALTNKIAAVLRNYLKLEYDLGMVDKLIDDIGAKMDGFLQDGAPDKNDWILDIDAQSAIYSLIEAAADFLKNKISLD
jgi:hypothetical protein